jgi:hypothetical protein
MAPPASEHSLYAPGAKEQLPRHIRELLMTRLQHARELHDRKTKTEHRRLYLICQAVCWVGLPALLALIAVSFRERPMGEIAPTAFIRPLSGLIFGFLLTHLARIPIRAWGWKHLNWRALIPRILALTAVLSAAWSGAHLLLDGLLGREHWMAEFTLGAIFLSRCVPGLVMFGPWLFAYFFYHLSDGLTRSEFERLRLAATAKESELRALKSQVNPHFIFNSLNSLRALIEEDPARARGAVTRLAGLLRYALQSAQLETVPLQDELRIINDYLALEQVRFEERLRFRVDAAPDTLALPVPPLLLQTLVENAVKYGVAPRPEGGEIAIRTWLENGTLRLEVANPGTLAPVLPGDDGSTGLGIKNAAERLRLLFGENARLLLQAVTPDRVLADVSIPLAEAEKPPSIATALLQAAQRCDCAPVRTPMAGTK